MVSRISGIGLAGIEEKVLAQHEKAFDDTVIALPIGGLYRYRAGGETHGHDGKLIHLLQEAVRTNKYETYKKYAHAVYAMPRVNLRDLVKFRDGAERVAIDEVESINEIRKRFVTPGMSLGALSPEAHGTLNIAMNRIGAKSDSGEGGDDPANFKPLPERRQPELGDQAGGLGRFGVTALYLNNCRELEIKIAQGAKPGEGGQLPGFKVTEMIARPPACDARRHAHLAAAAPRHLLDRGPRAAHLRLEADQPDGKDLREARLFDRHRHDRRRRREGEGGRHPHLGPFRGAPARARSPRSNMPARRGRWGFRKPTRSSPSISSATG